MCFDPVTMGILTFATGAAQSIAQYQAGVEESKATSAAAHAAFENDQRQLTLRQMQEADALSQKQSATNVEEAVKQADVQVSADQANISGISVENLVADVQRQAANNRQTQLANTKMAVTQLQEQKKQSRAQNQGRINSAPRPSALSLVAGIGGAALGGYNTYDKLVNA